VLEHLPTGPKLGISSNGEIDSRLPTAFPGRTSR
jgi:hypothetical protein